MKSVLIIFWLLAIFFPAVLDAQGLDSIGIAEKFPIENLNPKSGDIISIDPIHAYSDVDKAGWDFFLQEFNAWAHSRGGIPLLNQSPFIQKRHVVDAYGERWQKLSDWVKTIDPKERMLNPFFKELLL